MRSKSQSVILLTLYLLVHGQLERIYNRRQCQGGSLHSFTCSSMASLFNRLATKVVWPHFTALVSVDIFRFNNRQDSWWGLKVLPFLAVPGPGPSISVLVGAGAGAGAGASTLYELSRSSCRRSVESKRVEALLRSLRSTSREGKGSSEGPYTLWTEDWGQGEARCRMVRRGKGRLGEVKGGRERKGEVRDGYSGI